MASRHPQPDPVHWDTLARPAHVLTVANTPDQNADQLCFLYRLASIIERQEIFPDHRVWCEMDLMNTTTDRRAGGFGRALVTAITRLPIAMFRGFLAIWDVVSWLLAIAVLLAVRYDFLLTSVQWFWVVLYGTMVALLQVVGGFATHIYRGRSRTGSFEDATLVGFLTFGVALIVGIAVPLLSAGEFPRGIGFAAPMLALVLMGAGRWLSRAVVSSGSRTNTDGGIPALVYGAGNVGHEVARLIDSVELAPYSIVGFLDDDPAKRNLRISRYKVLGGGSDLRRAAEETQAETLILAITDSSPELTQQVSEGCDQAGLNLVVMPSVKERLGGKVTFGDLRKLNVADLLGRRPIETDLSAIADHVQRKVVLVTGAGGSIGSELAAQVYKLGPERLVLVDRDETALHSVELALYGTGMLTSDDMVLCDIRDEAALREVFRKHQPHMVFHAAALKHLPMLERFPAEGWKTNVVGTANVLKCAREVGVTHFVNVSTDKAADASSVLGQTKRLAERLTAWYADEYQLPYLSVRFGNVLGSRGSVLFAFRTQIERGGPVTVTHPDVTRYFMTIPEACQLVLQAAAIGAPGDVLVLDMGEPVKIIDVAKRLMAEAGKQVDIRFTGLRHGEKLHEVLFSDHENAEPTSHPLINRVDVPVYVPADLPAVAACVEVLPQVEEDGLNEFTLLPGGQQPANADSA